MKGLPAGRGARSQTRQPGGENAPLVINLLILLRLFLFGLLLLLLRLGSLGLRLPLHLWLWLRPGRRLHLALDLGGRLLHLGPRLHTRLLLHRRLG